ncbi:SH3 domain-containing protein [Helicobacter suis]|uniref:SH3 domain-containing protein n=1 Tax=Helicobacter suis TaxID=104628 RepID=UPI0013D894B2|nr:SH3 domain-containing protein [Helicobacter suis]
MAFKIYWKLYGYACGVLLLLLGLYVGVFMSLRYLQQSKLAPIAPPIEATQKTPEITQKTPENTSPTQNLEPPKTQETHQNTPQDQTPPQNTPQNTEVLKPKPTTSQPQVSPQNQNQDQVAAPPTPTPTPENAEPSYKTYYVLYSVVNVRLQPSTNAKVVAKILHGQEVQVLEIKHGWGRIKSGWVFLHLLKEK